MQNHIIPRYAGVFFIALLMLGACGESASPDLKKSVHVIRYMMAPKHLSRSMFSAAFENGKPSQFVSYIFSDMGAAEWPPSAEWADEMERRQAEAVGMPIIPKGVAFVHSRIDPTKSKQVVVTFDDEKSLVIVEAYTDPAKTAVLHHEWPFKPVKPHAGIAELYRSNAELGMSNQAF